MAERSWPFDDSDGDRPLNTEQWARGHTSLATNGVVPNVGDELVVTETSPESLGVQVTTGRFWAAGRLYEVFSEPETLPLASADPTNPRIDRIVVRRDLASREVVAAVLTGTPAADPDPPALTQNTVGVWEESLAQVAVAANAASVDDDDITDERRLARSPLQVPGLVPVGRYDRTSGGSTSDRTIRCPIPVWAQSLRRFWIVADVDSTDNDFNSLTLRLNTSVNDGNEGEWRTTRVRITSESGGTLAVENNTAVDFWSLVHLSFRQSLTTIMLDRRVESSRWIGRAEYGGQGFDGFSDRGFVGQSWAKWERDPEEIHMMMFRREGTGADFAANSRIDVYGILRPGMDDLPIGLPF